MTGLVYVILISLWGVVLVPRWLRHHDESRRRRESERIERALNPHRAPSPAAAADLDDDRYQSWGEYLRSLTRLDHSRWDSLGWVDSVRRPRSRYARRRRTIVVGLAGLFAVGIVGAVMGILPGFIAVFSALLLGGYLSALVVQHRHWADTSRAATVTPRQAAFADRVSAMPAGAMDGVRVMTGADARAQGSAWSPRETTLPTYTTKSKATKIPRRIDLVNRGWTGADMVEQARAQQVSPQLQQQFDREFAALEPDLDESVDAYANPAAEDDGFYRRAANE